MSNNRSGSKSVQIAMGGVFSGLCLVIMILAPMIPFATYFMPMLAGSMLAAVVIENGAKTAVFVYVSVSLLSLFAVADREAAGMFVCFFGFYPVLKQFLERMRSRVVGYALKLLVFNIAMVLNYLAFLYLFGIEEAAGDAEFLGKYGPLALLGCGNLVFLMYDYLFSRYIWLYVHWFRPKFLGKQHI